MNKKLNGKFDINYFLSYLNRLYPHAKCSLDYKKDYELVIVVMLSAQTTDASVNKVSKVLFKKYNTLEKLKKANLRDIEKIIHPLGLYKVKAKNILSIAKAINKKVLNNKEELMKLKGVGEKVSNVILAELYHLPYFAVDTHCSRIAKRLAIAKISDSPIIIEKKICNLIPKNSLILANHQMIEFGRNICTAKRPKCDECKIKCHFYQCLVKLRNNEI